MWTSMLFTACIFVPTIRTSELIVRRCCEENQVLRSGDCVPINNATSFSPPFYANLSQPLKSPSWQFEPLDCPYGCVKKYFPLNGANNSLEIKENKIYLKLKNNFSTDFCVGFDADGENEYIAAFCISALAKKRCPVGEALSLDQGSCLKRSDVKCRALEIESQMQTAELVISCLLVSLTIVLHLAIPTLRDLQSLCLLCHTFSLLVVVAVLCTRNLLSHYMSKIHCIFDAYILQYSLLATLFWLNVMCFDVWRTIKATVNMVRVTEITSNPKKKFIIYCVYAWGVPLVVIVSAAVYCLLKYPLDEFSCELKGTFADLLYLYICAGLVLFLNLVLLGHTIVMLIRAFNCCFRDTTFTAFNRKHHDGFSQRFILFCFMALCCLVDFVIAILSWKIFPRETWLSVLHFFASFHGFIVLLIFTSNKKKREAICNLFKNAKSSMDLSAKKISGMATTEKIWFITNVSGNLGNSTDTKIILGEGSTQESRSTEIPLEGIVNEGFEESEQKTSGE